MWAYPRPPIAVPFVGRVRVVHAGAVVADTIAAIRVLETSQPPAFYLPPADIDMTRLQRTSSRTWCEWKGAATYWQLDDIADVAWSYARPATGFEAITDHLAFYAQKVDEMLGRRRAGAAEPRQLLRRLDHVDGRRSVQGRARHTGMVTVACPLVGRRPG